MRIDAHEQSWPLDKPFRIARGTRTEARVVVVRVSDGKHTGRGEGVPLGRYNQSVESVLAQIESMKSAPNLDRQQIQKLLPAGAANIPIVHTVETSFTISLDTPAAMAAAARANAAAFVPQSRDYGGPRNAVYSILKLKLGGDNLDLPRVEAVREAAPAARLLIDANESWSPSHYRENVPALNGLGVELIEQPFPADADDVLETLDHPVPVCADESCHTSVDLPRLTNRYDAINVKLDKTGGLTEALLLTEHAREAGFKLLIGCMVCSSLGIAPARLLASATDYVDLDGPLLLAGDRHYRLCYQHGKIGMPPRELWG